MATTWQRCLAEAIGTFALIFIGAGAIIANVISDGGVGLVGIAFAHGIVLAVVVTATMNISGGHINPAVTVGLWSVRKIDSKHALLYIIAQLVGAVLGALALKFLYPAGAAASVSLGTPVPLGGLSFATAAAIEAVLTFFLVFAVFGTAVDHRAPKVGGFAIGLVLVFDILAGGPLTGASMNPARTFGPALVSGTWTQHLVYWIGPILGGVVAAIVYGRLLAVPESDG